MARLPLLPLLCLALTAGCVRTPDGSVTMERDWDVGQYWTQPTPPPRTPPVASGSIVFPVAPTDGWSRPARRTHRARRGKSAPHAASLACHNAVYDGRRTHVVCE